MSSVRKSRKLILAVGIFIVLVIAAVAGVYLTQTVQKTTQTTAQTTATTEANQNLTYVVQYEPKSLDPHTATAGVDGEIIANVYGRLVDLSPDGTQVLPDLATSWDISADGTTYTFHLRNGVKFHDGENFTAEDVSFSFQRAIKLGTGSSWMLSQVMNASSIQVIDSMTIKLVLTRPFSAILQVLSHWGAGAILSKDYVQKHAAANDTLAQNWLNENTDGTGPFMLKQWVHGQYIELVRNENYWKGPAKLQEIRVLFIVEPATAAILLQTGQADVVRGLPADVTASFVGSPNVTLVTGAQLQMTYLAFEVQLPPFNNVNVRQAIASAIDYDGILSEIVKSTGIRAYGPLLKGMLGYTETGFRYVRNITRARELLKDAGYVDNLVINLYYVQFGDLPDIAVVVQANLKDAGITVKLQLMPIGDYFEGMSEGKLGFFFNVGGPAYNDPDIQLRRRFASSNIGGGLSANIDNYSNPEVDQLLEQGGVETNLTTRAQIYQQVQDIVVRDAIWVPLYQSVSVVLMRNYVKGFVPAVLEGSQDLYPVYIQQ